MDIGYTKRPYMELSGIVLDCSDAEELADFYEKLLGWSRTHSGGGWAGLTAPHGLILAKGYRPPVWPWKEEQQGQMLHFDLKVKELEQAVAFALSCGARLADRQFYDTSTTLLDPAGHPFCLDTEAPESLAPDSIYEWGGMHTMKKVKITVLKTTLDEELTKEYGVEGLTPCPMLREGQVFYGDYAKPEGFCDEAWKAVYQYVFALAHGTGDGLFYYGDWIRKPGVAICSCNDGLRPVIFKLEATGEPSHLDYVPVR